MATGTARPGAVLACISVALACIVVGADVESDGEEIAEVAAGVAR